MNSTTKHFVVALYYYYQGNPIFNIHRAKAMKSARYDLHLAFNKRPFYKPYVVIEDYVINDVKLQLRTRD